jgi:homogentisate 1,2-dioxygenase
VPYYARQGNLPPTKHTVFRKGDGTLHREELFSTRGFGGAYSTKYHLHIPSGAVRQREVPAPQAEPWPDAPLDWLHFKTADLANDGDFIGARAVFLGNADCTIATARITKNTDLLYRNARASEYLFVHHGHGMLESEFGQLRFAPGDQLVVPRGVTYRLRFIPPLDARLLVVETRAALDLPAHYRNSVGQIDEGAPFCERDLRAPELKEPRDEQGEFAVHVKAGNRSFEQVLAHHPFDVVGWDGYVFPWAFNVASFHPRVGRVHLPPPVHSLLRNDALVLCNFVPRPYDFLPGAVPAPYYHSNVDCDEVLYYAAGEFMSRKGIVEGSITLHPAGLPHGPQPGRVEASLGAKGTDELAIMVDTFAPLQPTLNVKKTLDLGYAQSWL